VEQSSPLDRSLHPIAWVTGSSIGCGRDSSESGVVSREPWCPLRPRAGSAAGGHFLRRSTERSTEASSSSPETLKPRAREKAPLRPMWLSWGRDREGMRRVGGEE
jgi:hypothetical protein